MRFITSLAFSDPAHYTAIARTADACGWDGLALSDHVFFPETLSSPYPYQPGGKPFWEPSTPWPDVWVAIGAMAAVTSRLRFVTNVYVLPARNPFVVAKAVGTAAVMSDNRVVLGIGVGWMREEFTLLGQDFHTRGRRTDETIAVLRTLWRGGMVEHHGRFYDFDRLEMSPAPSAPVPIYVGGESEPALRRAASLGDGFISVLHSTEEIAALIARINGLRREIDRDRDPFDFLFACSDAFAVDDYRRLEDLGVTSLMTVPWVLYGGDVTQIEVKREGLERFANDVIAKM